jgi:hypothetical protein
VLRADWEPGIQCLINEKDLKKITKFDLTRISARLNRC